MNRTSETAIEAVGLNKGFRTGVVHTQVIRDLSLRLEKGALTLVMGPSGCGKSTLLALISGLLRPDSGGVTALGADLLALDDIRLNAFRQRYCGFIFQGFNLFSSLTAREQVQIILKYGGMDTRAAREAADEALSFVGLAHKAGLRPLELSGGEKQRVSIARALAKAPALLFADEPTSALDAANGERVVDLLKNVAHEKGAAVVCVTHDHRLEHHADRIVRLEDGQIVGDEVPNHDA